ncbi:MAG TPA: dihydropteroate synthase [Thermoanaerobaculia bacterium]|nr:dihydropteroate synthase [Thermoanaerobaculia bacterium]
METARLPGIPATLPTSTQWALRLPGGRRLPLAGGRPLVMGVLNLTPDSFSDGGLWTEPERAVDHALAMLEGGADMVDLGAESTRPGGGVYGAGARAITAEEELARLLPVLAPLRRATAAPLSVDTRKGEVARRALAAGADLINDVSALGDPVLAAVVAAAGCPLVLMHSRGELPTMQRRISFQDLVGEVRGELELAVGRAVAAGIDEEQLIVDPGLGFGKTAGQNMTLLRRLPELAAIGRPLLVGASRKSFIAVAERFGAPAAAARPAAPDAPTAPEAAAVPTLTAVPTPAPAPSAPASRLAGSLAALAWAAAGGAAIVRVHDVPESVRFLAAWRAIAAASEADT